MPELLSRLKTAFAPAISSDGLKSFGPVGTHIETAAKRARSRRFDAEASEWIMHIEAMREEMQADHSELASWDRPWLATSDELQAKVLTEQAPAAGTAASMTVSTAVEASKGKRECAFLLALVLETRPATVVEMGTNVGISGAYIAAGLAIHKHGKLITLEGSPSKADKARDVFRRLGLERHVSVITGDFAETLETAIQAATPVDLAFIDGFHDGAATLRYHDMFKASARDNAILVYDDIRWSEGMTRAWNEISADPDAPLSVDLGGWGLSVFSPESDRTPVRASVRL